MNELPLILEFLFADLVSKSLFRGTIYRVSVNAYYILLNFHLLVPVIYSRVSSIIANPMVKM